MGYIYIYIYREREREREREKVLEDIYRLVGLEFKGPFGWKNGKVK